MPLPTWEKIMLLTLIGTLSGMAIVAASSIGGLYILWPRIVPPAPSD